MSWPAIELTDSVKVTLLAAFLQVITDSHTQELRITIEGEHNEKAKSAAAICRESFPFVFTSYLISFT